MGDIDLFFESYKYLAVFLASSIDHTGTPAALLFSIGFVVAGKLNLYLVLFTCFLGGVFGDFVLFLFGDKIMATLTKLGVLKKEHKGLGWIKKKAVRNDFYAIVFGRFLPIVSRYFPIYYGAIKFSKKRFLGYTLLGNMAMTLGYGVPYYILNKKIEQHYDIKFIGIYLSLAIVIYPITVAVYRYFKSLKR